MKPASMFVTLLAVCFCAAAAEVPAPQTAVPAAKPATQPADRWAGQFLRVGGYRRKGDTDRVALVKEGTVYRLKGSAYDDYEFIEDKPGVLWDRKHVLGTITLGKMTFEAPGRLGDIPPQRVLNAQFCYDFFLLIETRAGQP